MRLRFRWVHPLNGICICFQFVYWYAPRAAARIEPALYHSTASCSSNFRVWHVASIFCNLLTLAVTIVSGGLERYILQEHGKCVEILIEAGAKTDIPDVNGRLLPESQPSAHMPIVRFITRASFSA
jgi:hypothetical protein